MSNSSSKGIFRFAHVFSLILGEHFHDHKGAFLAMHINVYLEVLTWLNWLTVEIPGDTGRWITTEEDLENDAVTVVNGLVPQRHGKPWRLVAYRRFQRYDSTWF